MTGDDTSPGPINYTVTVWIDFEEYGLVAAQETAAEIKRAIVQALDGFPVTEIETELAKS